MARTQLSSDHVHFSDMVGKIQEQVKRNQNIEGQSITDWIKDTFVDDAAGAIIAILETTAPTIEAPQDFFINMPHSFSHTSGLDVITRINVWFDQAAHPMRLVTIGRLKKIYKDDEGYWGCKELLKLEIRHFEIKDLVNGL